MQQHPSLEPILLQDPSPYMLSDADEIAYLLTQLTMQHDPLCLYPYLRREPFCISTLLEADAWHVYFDPSSVPETNQRFLKHGLTCVGTVQHVKIQISAPECEMHAHAGRQALRIDRPAAILQLQRRENYRQEVPASEAFYCIGRDGQRWPVHDLSQEGIGLLYTGNPAEVSTGYAALLDGAQLDVPGMGLLDVDLQIRTRREITLRSGQQATRLGCCFIDLPSRSRAILCGYLNALQRKRLAQGNG
ncbi:Flagellar brake protein YcgR [Andreprevotia sp. IGB-42]|uniref:flagellar brake protein n=1 Tax=Andreprevotia sp. IGB-42 TaxID=2497473 RepID=UPI00135A6830|nr:flagellar brake protein [Andreprevotia sp. IGB-42]KAF0814081.1 Flagellar brake protein YcgR [Andreprevotia sp. IGB-42]